MIATGHGALDTCAALLRDPALLDRDDPRADLQRLGPVLLAIAVACAAVFGLVVGSYRGGAQLAYSAIKAPILWLSPMLVALPAVRALYRVCGIEVTYARVVLAALVGSTRAALLLAVACPALWLVYSLYVDYHLAILAMCGALIGAGVLGLSTMARLLPGHGAAKLGAHLLAGAAMGIVLAQSGWVLRPFVARPRADVAFLRPIESNAFASVLASWRSARGRYDGWDARPEGLLARPQDETREASDR